MDCIQINFAEQTGKTIKPLHGVNRPEPKYDGRMDSLMETGAPCVRLHDCGGAYGRNTLVDIPNLFRDFDADADDPASYDFAFTDAYLQTIHASGMEILYRLGVTIEGWHKIRAYRIQPPADPLKWAKICEHVILHYNEGWADGFHFNITCWEIWNEPDNPDCWLGSREQFFELYRTSTNYLKQRFPHLRLGGYAGCGFYHLTRPESELNALMKSLPAWFEAFLRYVSAPETACVMDFFSFHLYSTDPNEIGVHVRYARRRLDEAGFPDTALFIDEWNYADRHLPGNINGVLRKEMPGAAFAAENFCVMQSNAVESACYYDAAPNGPYGGLFYFPSLFPAPTFYAFKAFNEVYKQKQEVFSAATGEQLFVCAGRGTSDSAAAILVNNLEQERTVELEFTGVPAAEAHFYLLDQTHSSLAEIPAPGSSVTFRGRSVLLCLYGTRLPPGVTIPDNLSGGFAGMQ